MDRDRWKVKAALAVAQFDCDPNQITLILNLKPTKTWFKGQPVMPIAKNVQKENGWKLESPADQINSSLEEQFNALWDLVEPAVPRFANLPLGAYVEFSCVIYSYTQRPIVYLPAKAIGQLARIGAAVDIDVYDLSSAEGT